MSGTGAGAIYLPALLSGLSLPGSPGAMGGALNPIDAAALVAATQSGSTPLGAPPSVGAPAPLPPATGPSPAPQAPLPPALAAQIMGNPALGAMGPQTAPPAATPAPPPSPVAAQTVPPSPGAPGASQTATGNSAFDPVVSDILATEGVGNGGKVPQGLGGLTDATWQDYANSPEGAGANRSNPQDQINATRWNTARNAALIKGTMGDKFNPSMLYAAQLLGGPGAAAMLQADPNADAQSTYAQAAGPKTAQQAFSQNGALLQPGSTVGQTLSNISNAYMGRGRGLSPENVGSALLAGQSFPTSVAAASPPQPEALGSSDGVIGNSALESQLLSHLGNLPDPGSLADQIAGSPLSRIGAALSQFAGRRTFGDGVRAFGSALGQSNQRAFMAPYQAQMAVAEASAKQAALLFQAQLMADRHALTNSNIVLHGAETSGANARIANLMAGKPTGQAVSIGGQMFQPTRGLDGAMSYVPINMQGGTTPVGQVQSLAQANSGTTANAQKMGQESASDFQDMVDGARDAPGRLQDLSQLQSLSQNGVGGAGLMQRLQRYIGANTGIQVGDLDPAAANYADNLRTRLQANQAQSMKGLGLRTQREFQTFVDAIPGMAQSPAAASAALNQLSIPPKRALYVYNAYKNDPNAQKLQASNPAGFQQWLTDAGLGYDQQALGYDPNNPTATPSPNVGASGGKLQTSGAPGGVFTSPSGTQVPWSFKKGN